MEKDRNSLGHRIRYFIIGLIACAILTSAIIIAGLLALAGILWLVDHG